MAEWSYSVTDITSVPNIEKYGDKFYTKGEISNTGGINFEIQGNYTRPALEFLNHAKIYCIVKRGIFAQNQEYYAIHLKNLYAENINTNLLKQTIRFNFIFSGNYLSNQTAYILENFPSDYNINTSKVLNTSFIFSAGDAFIGFILEFYGESGRKNYSTFFSFDGSKTPILYRAYDFFNEAPQVRCGEEGRVLSGHFKEKLNISSTFSSFPIGVILNKVELRIGEENISLTKNENPEYFLDDNYFFYIIEKPVAIDYKKEYDIEIKLFSQFNNEQYASKIIKADQLPTYSNISFYPAENGWILDADNLNEQNPRYSLYKDIQGVMQCFILCWLYNGSSPTFYQDFMNGMIETIVCINFGDNEKILLSIDNWYSYQDKGINFYFSRFTQVINKDYEFLGRVLQQKFNNDFIGNNKGFNTVKISLILKDMFDETVYTSEEIELETFLQLKQAPTWEPEPSYFLNEVEWNNRYRGIPTIFQNEQMQIKLKEAIDNDVQENEKFTLKYEYSSDYGENWQVIDNQTFLATIDFKPTVHSEIQDFYLRVSPLYNGESLNKELTFYPEENIVSIRKTREQPVDGEIIIKGKKIYINFSDLGSDRTDIFTYNELLDNKNFTGLTRYPKTKAIFTIYKIENNNKEKYDEYILDNTLLLREQEDFFINFSKTLDDKTEYQIEINFYEDKNLIKTITTLNTFITDFSSLSRPTVGMRQNGLIINGAPGQPLDENEFIEINCLNLKKKIVFNFYNENEYDAAPIASSEIYCDFEGKIHLSGFVID